MSEPSDRSNRFLRACRGEPVDTVPAWIMRQAGRYLPEYRRVRGTTDFLTLCKTPALATEVTLQPIDILDVDAAIVFSDILIPLEAMGLQLTIDEGEGPRIHNPVRSGADIERLAIPDPVEKTGFTLETIRQVRRSLGGKVPLIGFAGAPFTLAAYAVEGGGSKNFVWIKRLMFDEPKLFERLMEKLADTVIAFLCAQIEAGAQAVQIFDSWGGVLSPRDFNQCSLPWLRRVVEGVRGRGAPVIVFGTDMGLLLESLATTGADVVGVDWRIGLGEARRRLGPTIALQGNLDPITLFARPEVIGERVEAIVREGGGRGHIFNLGHGILPETPVEGARAAVDAAHRAGRELSVAAR